MCKEVFEKLENFMIFLYANRNPSSIISLEYDNMGEDGVYPRTPV